MTDLADLLARAEAALAQLPPASAGVSAVIDGIPCASYPIAQAWATQAKAMTPPPASALDAALGWVSEHARTPDCWTVVTRDRYVTQQVFVARRLVPWLALPVLALGRVDRLRTLPPISELEVAAPKSAAEFLAVFGDDLAPLVAPGLLSVPTHHFLVGRVGGEPVACAQVREVMGTAYVSAITVAPAARGRGLGTAMSAAATRLALALNPRAVWLSAQTHLHGLYGRLGYRQVAVHVQLRPE
jgi:GNAT superfamily N-acetyltransferase